MPVDDFCRSMWDTKYDTLFVTADNTNVSNKLPPLITGISYVYVTSSYPFTQTKYVIDLVSICNMSRCLSFPRRVLRLDLEASNIKCGKSSAYVSNNKVKQTRLPMSVLRLNINSTSVYKLPLMKLHYLSNYCWWSYTDSRILTESIIDFRSDNSRTPKERFIPKSVRDLGVCHYPTNDYARQCGILDLALYNIIYKMSKNNTEFHSHYRFILKPNLDLSYVEDPFAPPLPFGY